jgi:hypothetical protein
MKKVLFLFIALLAFVAFGTPCALADDIVDITVPVTTFHGGPNCPLCTEIFSSSFEYDNTTNTVLLSTVTTKTEGECCFSLFSYDTSRFTWQDDTFSQVILDMPSRSTSAILPGVYTAELSFSTDNDDFEKPNLLHVPVTVVPAPEPSAALLFIPGLLALTVFRPKRATT